MATQIVRIMIDYAHVANKTASQCRRIRNLTHTQNWCDYIINRSMTGAGSDADGIMHDVCRVVKDLFMVKTPFTRTKLRVYFHLKILEGTG